MQYATPTKQVKHYQMESKSFKNMAYVQSESTAEPQWNWKHPSIQENFFQKIDPPACVEDASIKMSCHQHAVKDFELQIEMNELEMSMLKDGDEVLPYNESKMDELEQKKLKLLLGKRFHQNAMNAYWYYLERSGK
jgi:hypothetical protein